MSNEKRVLLTPMMGAVSGLALDTADGMTSSGAVASHFVKPAFAETHSGGGQGQGGQGPRAGQAGTSGGKPVWASERIPEVELGYLSVARSRDSVQSRALDEAVSTFPPEMADFYQAAID